MADFVTASHKTPLFSQNHGTFRCSPVLWKFSEPFRAPHVPSFTVQQYTCGWLRLAESDRNNAKDNDDADANESEREGFEEGDDEPTNLP
jgi:hypothetical protein